VIPEVKMAVFSVQEAKAHFSKLLELVMNGEEVIIATTGKPVARIWSSTAKDTSQRDPGIDKGKVIIQPDFDAPFSEFDL